MLLVASLGAVFILLTTYVSMFASERRAYLVLWFLGWAVIALNYALNAFFSDLLRANRLIFLISTSSYFLADLMIFFVTYSFLEIRIAKPLWIGGAVVWMAGFAALATAGVKDYILIVCVNASLFLMALRIGISMIRVGRRQRRLAHFSGRSQPRLGSLRGALVLCFFAEPALRLRRHARHTLCQRDWADSDELRRAEGQNRERLRAHQAPFGA
jgi:hypothetical protein